MGITSRRKAENLLTEGRITINGRVVRTPGVKADPEEDHIRIDGKLLRKFPPPSYYLLNKPAGYLCSLSDPQKRPLVVDLLKDVKGRVYPAGRLDYNTEGLLILTNDGEFARRLQHPSVRCPKTYWVKVRGEPGPDALRRLEKGITLEGKKTLPCRVHVSRRNKMTSYLTLTLYEGRKNQIKKMFSAIGFPVKKLQRIAIGPLRIDRPRIAKGAYRRLTDKEINQMLRLMKGS